MSKRLRDLARNFRALSAPEFEGTVSATLLGDQLDCWRITFHYDNKKIAILDFNFDLAEPKPPVVLARWPHSLDYICYEELGTEKWRSDNDLVTLMLSLHHEIKDRSPQVFGADDVLRDEKLSQERWDYVRSAHSDWKMEKVNTTINVEEIERLREEGTALVSIATDLLPDSSPSTEDTVPDAPESCASASSSVHSVLCPLELGEMAARLAARRRSAIRIQSAFRQRSLRLQRLKELSQEPPAVEEQDPLNNFANSLHVHTQEEGRSLDEPGDDVARQAEGSAAEQPAGFFELLGFWQLFEKARNGFCPRPVLLQKL